jgi:hypothetical protein
MVLMIAPDMAQNCASENPKTGKRWNILGFQMVGYPLLNGQIVKRLGARSDLMIFKMGNGCLVSIKKLVAEI